MKKRLFKSILLIVFVILMLFNNSVCYGGVVDTSITINMSPANDFSGLGNRILTVIRIVGMIVSVGALMVIGIRYMLSSVDEKAEMKKSLIYYCIGAVLVFAIVNIVSAIYEALK